MPERDIGRAEVLAVLSTGETIATYPDDRPIPSALLSKRAEPPLHVVAAFDHASLTCFVITAYRPGDTYFEPDFKTRKRQ